MPATPCLNCDTPLTGRWCHACGQDSRDPVREFGPLVAEATEGVFGWDSRFVRTVRLLFAEPGALTEAFVAGQRARYVGPVRLYLIVSVLFFASFAVVPDPVIATIAGLGDPWLGQARIEGADRWLPTLMIFVLPAMAMALHLLFIDRRRPVLATQVLVLHFGSIAFASMAVGHLTAWLALATGARPVAIALLYGAHAVNSVYLWLMLRRFYGTGIVSTAGRLGLYFVAMTVILGGSIGLVDRAMR